jgi:hypothetical protein
MEEWDVNEYQGRRRDQVEKSYKITFASLGLFLSGVIVILLYLYIK